jgi:SAM-dependent methyltransferase
MRTSVELDATPSADGTTAKQIANVTARDSEVACGTAAAEATQYQAFWSGVGTDFPSLKGAVSTDYYAECEQTLLRDLFPDLRGRRLFKTDLWDEAKNTEILAWAAERGARVAGCDIAVATVVQARDVLGPYGPAFAGGDVRSIPFADDTFDLLYSMGTIEHFPEYREAIAECYRVLKPGGRAIIGVPNKLDPFLRPLMVAVLNGLGRYDYGVEKSFTARGLRRLLEDAGFRVLGHSGILFMPGWLRMADLWFHTRGSRLRRLTGALTRPFAALYRHVPAVRRHGYLIALSAEKPVERPPEKTR